MRVAVIDNYDSFVYNLVHYIGELGAEPVVFMNDASLSEIRKSRPEKLVISPGPKTPKEAGISVKAVLEFGKEIPVLGVCLGHQAIAYAFGGKVIQAKQLVHGKVSRIKHSGGPLFKGIPNSFEATRYHSLAVDPASLPSCLKVTAVTDDRFREIMAIEHREAPIYGVQFHPESILTNHGKRLIKNFLEI